MPISRRNFIRLLGLSLASTGFAYVSRHPLSDHSSWVELRKLWQELDEQFLYSKKNLLGYQQVLALLDRAALAYRAELNTLVIAGEIEPQVASRLLAVYLESAYHVWRSTLPATCYSTTSEEIESQFSRERLREQADILENMASQNLIFPNTVKLAQAAMQKEIAFLSQVNGIGNSMLDRGYASAQSWAESGSETDDERYAQKAADILASLLLGETP